VNRATDSTEVTLPIRQVEVQILHEETECEMAHEACGFCTNGQTERGAVGLDFISRKDDVDVLTDYTLERDAEVVTLSVALPNSVTTVYAVWWDHFINGVHTQKILKMAANPKRALNFLERRVRRMQRDGWTVMRGDMAPTEVDA